MYYYSGKFYKGIKTGVIDAGYVVIELVEEGGWVKEWEDGLKNYIPTLSNTYLWVREVEVDLGGWRGFRTMASKTHLHVGCQSIPLSMIPETLDGFSWDGYDYTEEQMRPLFEKVKAYLTYGVIPYKGRSINKDKLITVTRKGIKYTIIQDKLVVGHSYFIPLLVENTWQWKGQEAKSGRWYEGLVTNGSQEGYLVTPEYANIDDGWPAKKVIPAPWPNFGKSGYWWDNGWRKQFEISGEWEYHWGYVDGILYIGCQTIKNPLRLKAVNGYYQFNEYMLSERIGNFIKEQIIDYEAARVVGTSKDSN